MNKKEYKQFVKEIANDIKNNGHDSLLDAEIVARNMLQETANKTIKDIHSYLEKRGFKTLDAKVYEFADDISVA